MAFTRRTFMRWGGLVPPLLVANPFGVFRSLIGPKGDQRPAKSLPANPFVRDGRTLVSMVHGTDVPRMIAEAIALIGGLDRLAVRGKTVLVKPNVVSSDPPPTTTNPAVVAAVVRLLVEAEARRVIVGEMSGVIRLPTWRNLEETGVARVAREAGAEVITFDDGEWIEVKPPRARLVDRIHVAKPVYEADLLVNVPVVKTHAYAGYSICLKNLVGVTHPRYRPYRINASKWEELVAEMNLAAHPSLNVVDATTCMIAGGPVGGTAATTNLILASGDRVAADVVGLALIARAGQWEKVTSLGVWKQRQIWHAQALGVGLTDPASLALVARSLETDAGEFERLLDDVHRLTGVSA
ncbi:MAG: DUF362 domain-containing protein [Nitrospirota bacterium]